MKAIFGRSSRRSSVATGFSSSSSSHSTPDISQPSPERRLTIHATPSGLVVAPKLHSNVSTPQHQHQQSSSSGCGSGGSLEHKVVTTPAAIKLAWNRDAKIEQVAGREIKSLLDSATEDAEIQAFGIVGIMRVFNYAYLLVITSRSHAGDFFHASLPIYRCSGVLAIPLSHDMALPILKAENARQAMANQGSGDTSSSESDDSDGEDVQKDEVLTPSLVARESFLAGLTESGDTSASSYAATLKPARGKSWTAPSRRERVISEGNPALAERENAPPHNSSLEQATAPGDKTCPSAEGGSTAHVELPNQDGTAGSALEDDANSDNANGPALTPDEQWHEATKAELEDKLVREAAKLFARGEMWFSYDLDITTSLQRKHALVTCGNSATTAGLPFQEPSPLLPLWKRVDRRFWYNEALSKNFVDLSLHAYILPIMQGYFQVTNLPIPSAGSQRASLEGPGSSVGDAMDAVTEAASADDAEAQLMIISRRSKERAGLRYQRRGINDAGQVANYTETEQITFTRKGTQSHLLSFVQFRGSIPLFWSQSPFSMKPPPVLERSDADNVKACSKHFDEQVQRYGKVTCINLAEQHGKEGQITEAYRKRVEEDIKKGDSVKYVAFDFHKECSAMRFENVSKLLGNVHETMESMGYFWASKKNATSAITIASKQMGAFRVSCLDCLDRTNVVQSAFGRHVLGIQLGKADVTLGTSKDEDFEFVYNDTWANNGDMISQAYAGTRALKGDFTRTGKRNFFGMMNDATASVYRMVQGAVTDFFRQTVIDFVHGGLSLNGLERYNDQLAAQDPAESFRLARVRASAIETCASMVLGEDETHLGGWTLFSPVESSQIHGSKFEEKVVLLTPKALYSCGYDFTSEKLSEFSRILIGDIVGIKKGLYIISPNEAYHPEDNWGMVLSYLTEEKRLNNASIRNMPPPSKTSTTNFLAFRAVRSEGNDFSISTNNGSSGTSGGSAATNEQQKWGHPSSNRGRQKSSSDDEVLVLTPRQTIDRLVGMVVEQCRDVGACEDGEEAFVTDETIQSLAQAKANASLFAPLLEGLKRRLWL
ncbi:hypothetical protein K437DRAFT_253878 [Tilletiaria anomala UBC 951]|uniref:SAC domain-containing protein n=1 Tax=Tilletiaria anomala (strain ATCC 24038 / CBS 436.72 / UBC 951) TaxID=1037660 RepID=A0A066WNV2_TILAU|nr:uncharacterized protein K437DRAFT_253878 [Tilletiaria anomala UBC 951]KDN52684.1 hypothetical protein K437DRAFT_253878 [Tilletiaria anomala UBC 951]